MVLAGGGTAGHVNPLLSVADAIRQLRPDAAVSVVGTAVGLESRLVPRAGYPLDTIAKVPFPRRPNLAALRFPAAWIRETRRVRRLLVARHADVVVGFGGYAAAPVYRAAHRMGIPIAIHEQNARAGMANRLGARWATYIGTVYDHTGLKPGGATRIERVGLPLRPAISRLCGELTRDRAAVRRACAVRLGVDASLPVIVVTGGSLGAQHLNEAVAGAADALMGCTQVIHLTGAGRMASVRAMVERRVDSGAFTALAVDGNGGTGVSPDAHNSGRALSAVSAVSGDYHAAEYLERIDLVFGCADLVICRAGAGTVAELSALGIPAVYVPLPIGNGEQRFNAQPVVQAGGGLMVPDAALTSAWIRGHVPELLADRARIAAMSQAAWDYGVRDAAHTVALRVLGLVRPGAGA